LDCAKNHIPLFRVIVALVCPLNRKNIIEHIARTLEANAVIKPVLGRLEIIPFETVILHRILPASSFINWIL